MIYDTIAAVSTPYGKGGVALLRVSGDNAAILCSRVFRPANGKALSDITSNYFVYGKIYMPDGVPSSDPSDKQSVGQSSSGSEIDDGMAVVFRAPHSFTGEETVEITCHGGILVTQTVLEALFRAGARPATAGEFTRRAFLNGKLGLTGAEALGTLLDAKTHEQIKLARAGINGKLSGETGEIYNMMKSVLAAVFARIDYPDEDLADMSPAEMSETLDAIITRVQKLAATYRTGHAVSEGINTVICGRTNAGKSSLYNRLVGRDAAIVTDIEGTTRDILTETVKLGRVTLRLCDTAGLRGSDNADPVERIGISRAYAAVADAELILAVFDGSRTPDTDDLNLIKTLSAGNGTVIAVINKTDAGENAALCQAVIYAFGNVVKLSAVTGQGMDVLTDAVNSLFTDGELDLTNDAVVANARQYAAVTSCADALTRAKRAVDSSYSFDLCCSDIEYAMRALGEIDGREVSDDVINEIFSKFCVGK